MVEVHSDAWLLSVAFYFGHLDLIKMTGIFLLILRLFLSIIVLDFPSICVVPSLLEPLILISVDVDHGLIN